MHYLLSSFFVPYRGVVFTVYGMTSVNDEFVLTCCADVRVFKHWCLVFSLGLGGFGELREACKNQFMNIRGTTEERTSLTRKNGKV